MLTFMLAACSQTRKIYEDLQISETIFLDTMKCFPRFINEHLESYGTYGFDRDFWTMLQMAARLFRLGSLEYELTEAAGQKAVHIPHPLRRGSLPRQPLCFLRHGPGFPEEILPGVPERPVLMYFLAPVPGP